MEPVDAGGTWKTKQLLNEEAVGGGGSCVHVSVMNFCLAEVTRALFSSHAPRFWRLSATLDPPAARPVEWKRQQTDGKRCSKCH